MWDPDGPRLQSRRGIRMEKLTDKQITYLGCVIQIDEGRRCHTPVNHLVDLEMLASCLFGQRYEMLVFIPIEGSPMMSLGTSQFAQQDQLHMIPPGNTILESQS
jgi:hypothetical protein